jgi:uncharacterized protein YjbI with pentapeptide repeats
LPYAQSSDFAYDKDGGTPCHNLQEDYRCGIHTKLRSSGFRGCTVYECYGAGQKVSQLTYSGRDWRGHPETAKEMFEVLPIMQQLHEMLYYLDEALHLEATRPIHADLRKALEDTEQLTNQSPVFLLDLHVPTHRAKVNALLLQTSEMVRKPHNQKLEPRLQNKIKGRDLLGAKLRGANLKGANLRGVFFIAADLRDADLRMTDLIGADLRDADLSGANLTGSLFLTQAQINSAQGDQRTKLPPALCTPAHWTRK